jgi:hypothetical protein
MRKEFYDELLNIATNSEDVKSDLLWAITAEQLRGFQAGDVNDMGEVIIGIVPDLDSIDLTPTQKQSVAYEFDDNDACRDFLIQATYDIWGMIGE